MSREEELVKLNDVRLFHINAMNKISRIIRNRSFMGIPPEVLDENCRFNLWLNENNNYISTIIGSIFYTELVETHRKWHSLYASMYKDFFTSRKLVAILNKIENSTKDVEKEKLLVKLSKIKIRLSAFEEERLMMIYHDMKNVSSKLLLTLESSERKLKAASSSLFID